MKNESCCLVLACWTEYLLSLLYYNGYNAEGHTEVDICVVDVAKTQYDNLDELNMPRFFQLL